VQVSVLDPTPRAPASVAASQTVGSFAEASAVRAFAATVDVLTVEVEHVDAATLAQLEAEGVCQVVPCAAAVALIQDKLGQKRHFAAAWVPLAPFAGPLRTAADVEAAAATLGFPLVLKSRRGAYDGRGNATAADAAALPAALQRLGGLSAGADGDGALYAEGWAPFSAELAVMVVRSRGGELRAYPVVQTEHEEHICSRVTAPAPRLSAAVAAEAERVALMAVGSLPGAGVFGVELFLLPDGSVLLNEVAPRPHNSGHYSIDAVVTCQYENALRAVLGWPLGDAQLARAGGAAMLNVLGTGSGGGAEAAAHRLLGAALAAPGAAVHWYGKACAPRRKVGHITVVAASAAEAHARLDEIARAAAAGDAVAAAGGGWAAALEATAGAARAAFAPRPPPPLVGVIMGSDSDLPCMSAACAMLDQFAVPYEVTIVSAHRTPDRLLSYGRAAAARGLRCIIAGAGGAAHLPGMIASLTPLPVIGVPVPLKHLDGMDSLLSIVQMPVGIPVATVAVGSAGNAGLLAVRVLAAGDAELRARMEVYQAGLEEAVSAKAARLEAGGWRAYLDGGKARAF